MGLIDDLGSGRIGVDTAIFITLIEEAPAWLPVVRSLFLSADAVQFELVTSAVTLLGVRVVPYRTNNDTLAARYETLLTRSRGIQLVEVTGEQLRSAAKPAH